jgi:SRSO17 transposase
LAKVRAWVLPELNLGRESYWIVDDTGLPKKGSHSVGVAHQYCGQLGKQANCQVAVSLSLSTERGSLPVQWRLYVPESWADDPVRRAIAGIPPDLAFATKPALALAQIRATLALGWPAGIVLADAAYGNDTAFRDGVTALGLRYAVGIQAAVTVWGPGEAPLPPAIRKPTGRPPSRLRRDPDHSPQAVQTLAQGLPPAAWRTVAWREAPETPCVSRFAAVRVRPAHRDRDRTTVRAEEWLLIEWPEGESEPSKYWLATLPAETPLERLVSVAKGRWRIERDYEDLKQELGLGHFEGRGWRGFHHHATLCIAAYGYLVAHRLTAPAGEKNPPRPQAPGLSASYRPRGHRSTATPCGGLDHDPPLRNRPGHRAPPSAMPLLRRSPSAVMTQ